MLHQALFLDRSFFSSFFICKWSSPIIISSCLLNANDTCNFCQQQEDVKNLKTFHINSFHHYASWSKTKSSQFFFGKDKKVHSVFKDEMFKWNFVSYSIKQHSTVEFDSKLSDKVMASKVLRKINSKLKLLYRQSRYQFPAFRRILSNSLIQPHFDLKKKLKNKYQKDQNKHIPFSLNLIPRSHIDPSHFRKIKWLPASRRVEYYIANTVFKH